MKKGLFILFTVAILLMISTGCTSKTKDAEVNSTSTTKEATTTGSNATAEQSDFTMTINGKTFTQDDAKDLDYVTKDVKKIKKDGSEVGVSCSGYQVDQLLQAAGVTDYTSVTVAASDGFSAEITGEQAKLETTIFGLSQEGEELKADELPILVVDGEGSKTWVKGIITVTTK